MWRGGGGGWSDVTKPVTSTSGGEVTILGIKIAGDGIQSINAVAADSRGDIIVAGYFEDEIDYGNGSGPFTSSLQFN